MLSSVTLKSVGALGFSLSNLSPSMMTFTVWGKNATTKVYNRVEMYGSSVLPNKANGR